MTTSSRVRRPRGPRALGRARERPAVLRAIALVGALVPLAAACETDSLAPLGFRQAGAERWQLPDRLREISGLALNADDHLLAHDDERAVIYVLDHRRARRLKTFALGDPVARDDFEGIAVAEGRVYLVTSAGRLYSAEEAADGGHAPFQTAETGLGERCEVEGLAYVRARGALAIACKTPRGDAPLAVHFYSLAAGRVTSEPLAVPMRALAGALGTEGFSPSGIEWVADRATFVLVAAREAAIAELGADGRLLAAARLPRRHHRQPEGVAVDGDGRLIIADEGDGRRARLSVYPAGS